MNYLRWPNPKFEQVSLEHLYDYSELKDDRRRNYHSKMIITDLSLLLWNTRSTLDNKVAFIKLLFKDITGAVQ